MTSANLGTSAITTQETRSSRMGRHRNVTRADSDWNDVAYQRVIQGSIKGLARLIRANSAMIQRIATITRGKDKATSIQLKALNARVSRLEKRLGK